MRICLRRLKKQDRRGLSLPELLASLLILGLIAASLGGVALAVARQTRIAPGIRRPHNTRVTLAWLERNIGLATANENFPGCRVFTTTVSGDFSRYACRLEAIDDRSLRADRFAASE